MTWCATVIFRKHFIALYFLFFSPAALSITADVDICFTPGERCDIRIINAIDHAQRMIDVQAYQLTSAPIKAALVRANERGVKVKIILDKSQIHKYDISIPAWIDRKPAIAHNKVMIIDDNIVITGSYNFSANAQCRNAENLVIIKSHQIANRYLSNFDYRLRQSFPLR